MASCGCYLLSTLPFKHHRRQSLYEVFTTSPETYAKMFELKGQILQFKSWKNTNLICNLQATQIPAKWQVEWWLVLISYLYIRTYIFKHWRKTNFALACETQLN